MPVYDSAAKDETNGTRSDSLEIALAPSERDLYEFIRRHGEVMTSNLPPKMMGALPRLIKRGLVVIYKKPTMPWSEKKRKFVAVKE